MNASGLRLTLTANISAQESTSVEYVLLPPLPVPHDLYSRCIDDKLQLAMSLHIWLPTTKNWTGFKRLKQGQRSCQMMKDDPASEESYTEQCPRTRPLGIRPSLETQEMQTGGTG